MEQNITLDKDAKPTTWKVLDFDQARCVYTLQATGIRRLWTHNLVLTCYELYTLLHSTES